MFKKSDIVEINPLSDMWHNGGGEEEEVIKKETEETKIEKTNNTKKRKKKNTVLSEKEKRAKRICSMAPFLYKLTFPFTEEQIRTGIVLDVFPFPESQQLFLRELYSFSLAKKIDTNLASFETSLSKNKDLFEKVVENKISICEIYLLNSCLDREIHKDIRFKRIFVLEDCLFLVGKRRKKEKK
jgi:hypothetical protein